MQNDVTGDGAGYSVGTAGDVNGDGFDDLAIGIPLEDAVVGSSSFTNCGSVLVLYGSNVGLSRTGLKLFPSYAGDKTEAHFGFALAAGDFDADGFDDLAMSAHGLDVEVNGLEVANAGAVYLLWGSAAGLTHLNHLKITRGAFGIPGPPQEGDYLGSSLVRGDWNGDGRDDLAIGAYGQTVGGVQGGPGRAVRARGVRRWW